jgi:hypothetical protein
MSIGRVLSLVRDGQLPVNAVRRVCHVADQSRIESGMMIQSQVRRRTKFRAVFIFLAAVRNKGAHALAICVALVVLGALVAILAGLVLRHNPFAFPINTLSFEAGAICSNRFLSRISYTVVGENCHMHAKFFCRACPGHFYVEVQSYRDIQQLAELVVMSSSSP